MTPIRVNVACLSVSVSDFSPLMPQAGVDPLAGDIMGRLNLSREGLQKRNQHVFEEVLGRGIKCVVTFGGGYQKDRRVAVEAHTDVYCQAAAMLKG